MRNRLLIGVCAWMVGAMPAVVFAANFEIFDAVYRTTEIGSFTSLFINDGNFTNHRVTARALGPGPGIFVSLPTNEPGKIVSLNSFYSPDAGSFTVGDRPFPIDVAHPSFMNFRIGASTVLPTSFMAGEFVITGTSIVSATLTTCGGPECGRFTSLTGAATGTSTWRLFGDPNSSQYQVRSFAANFNQPLPGNDPSPFEPGDPRFTSWTGPFFDEEGRGFAKQFIPDPNDPFKAAGNSNNGIGIQTGSNGVVPAIPEPSTILLLASGFVTIAYLRRRSSRL